MDSTSTIDLTEAREFICGLVEEAGRIARKYFEGRNFTIHAKKGTDFATQADLEVQAFLIQKIKEKYPATQFLAEETAPEDYSSMREISGLWVIDPIDGTWNFARGHTNFAISVALVDKGQSVLGVVHQPAFAKTYWAEADTEGAFLNGERIHVSTTDLKHAVLATEISWGPIEENARTLGQLALHVQQVKIMGSGVSDQVSVAEGIIDAYLHVEPYPWDIAATGLIVEKAGGKVTDPAGKPWHVFQQGVLASNGIVPDAILDLLNKRS